MVRFRSFEHARLERRACFSGFRSGRVLCNRMCNGVRWRNDAGSRIDHHNGNQNLREEEILDQKVVERRKFSPVKPSFLLQVSHVQRLRFFFSELTGEAPSEELSVILESFIEDTSIVSDITGAEATWESGLVWSSSSFIWSSLLCVSIELGMISSITSSWRRFGDVTGVFEEE